MAKPRKTGKDDRRSETMHIKMPIKTYKTLINYARDVLCLPGSTYCASILARHAKEIEND